MQARRWMNQSQPQTLVIAVFLMYFDAVFTLLLGSESANYVLLGLVKLGVNPFSSLEDLVRIALAAGAVGAGYLIANERRWGYRLGVIVAGLPVVGAAILMLLPSMNGVPRFSLENFSLISLLVVVALIALLLHPQSRDYERIWFK